MYTVFCVAYTMSRIALTAYSFLFWFSHIEKSILCISFVRLFFIGNLWGGSTLGSDVTL